MIKFFLTLKFLDVLMDHILRGSAIIIRTWEDDVFLVGDFLKGRRGVLSFWHSWFCQEDGANDTCKL